MSRKYSVWICVKVPDREEAALADGLEALVGQLSFLFQRDVELWCEERPLQELRQLLSHLVVVVFQEAFEFRDWDVRLWPGSPQRRWSFFVVQLQTKNILSKVE